MRWLAWAVLRSTKFLPHGVPAGCRLQRTQITVLAISFMVSNVEGECPGAKWPFAEPAPASSFRVECHRASWKRTIPIYLPLPPVPSADIVPVVTKNASSKQYADCRAANGAVEYQHWQPRSRLVAACHDVALRANVAPVL